MIKYVLCDIDNTLLDTLGKLEEIVPTFKRDEHKTYTLNGELLEAFNDGSVYEGVKLNESIKELLDNYKKEGRFLIFISQTFTDIAREKKYEIIENLYEGAQLFTYDSTIEDAIQFMERMVEHDTSIVILDDAPERVERYKKKLYGKPNVELKLVEYPYNTFYRDELEIEMIQPNK